MAQYIIGSTVAQEEILSWVVARVNAERAKQNPPLTSLTNDQYIKSLLAGCFKDWKMSYETEEVKPIQGKWESLTPMQKTQIKTIAGI